jgi:hypothetical protein
MPRQMVKPKIREVSGVDHPAHLLEGWLMMKDASPETAVLLAQAEAIAKGIDPSTLAEETNMGLTDEVRAALPDDVRKYIGDLESDLTVAKAAAAAPVDDEAEFLKSLEGMAPTVKDAFLKSQRRVAEAEAVAKSLVDEREAGEFEAMAKSLVHLPKVTPSEFGPVLRKAAASTDETTFGSILDVLKAADKAIAQSGLFREIGTGHGGTTDSALGSIEAVAKSLEEADPALTHAEAIVKAAEQHPDLYAQHRQEA